VSRRLARIKERLQNMNQLLNRKTFAALTVTLVLGWATTLAAAVRYVNPDGVCGGNLPCHTTIQSAIDQSGDLDTVMVAAGTYHESVNLHVLGMTLKGAQAGVDARSRSGPESIIDSPCSPVRITSEFVTVDGFTVQGSTQGDPCTLAGIWVNGDTYGKNQIFNNIVQNNISGIEFNNQTPPVRVQFNLIRNNNNPGPGSGNGIQSNFVLVNTLIDNNTFIGNKNASILVTAPSSALTIRNNTLDRGIVLFKASFCFIENNISNGNTGSGTIYLGGGNSGVTISDNVLNNGVEAVVVADPFNLGPNSGIVLSPNNCIAGNSLNGLRVASGSYTGALDATNNWWGAASGPRYNGGGAGTGDNITDPGQVVVYSPWRMSKAGTPCFVAPPTNASQCKNDGWKIFDTPRSFKNQGDCIQFVNTGK
jgi:hypothetical protein